MYVGFPPTVDKYPHDFHFRQIFFFHNPEFGWTDHRWVGKEALTHSSIGVCIFTEAPLGTGLNAFLSIRIGPAALGNF